MDAQEFSLYLCPTCGKQFDSKIKLSKHTRQVHDLRPESCKECGKRCFGKLQLATHMRSHQTFRCNICLNTVAKNSVSDHKLKCNGVELECTLCIFKTVRPNVMKLHEKKHNKVLPANEEVPAEQIKTKTFACKYCGKVFEKKKTLKDH